MVHFTSFVPVLLWHNIVACNRNSGLGFYFWFDNLYFTLTWALLDDKCNTVRYGTRQYMLLTTCTIPRHELYWALNTIQYDIVHYNVIHFRLVFYLDMSFTERWIQYNTIRYSTMQCNTFNCRVINTREMCHDVMCNTREMCHDVMCNPSRIQANHITK